MKSVWQEEKPPEFPALQGELHTDVLIIGGGIAGILTAYYLRRRGVDCVLVEKNRICSGNTGRTTGKITAQHGLNYHKIAKARGLEGAEKYYRANVLALEEYARLCGGIDCDFQRKDNFVYTTDDREKLEKEMAVLDRIGAEAFLFDQVPLPVSAAGAICFPNQAQFHPLKFLRAVSGGLRILEHTFVKELAGSEAITQRGSIFAERIVCCTHFPFINKHGLYPLKLYQHRSYVIGLENAQQVNGMYVDEKAGGLSFRNQGDLLLLGGCGGRTGKPWGGWEELRGFAGVHYPQARERYFWAAQDCMSLDGMPYIGSYGRGTTNFYVETGFNKWGMTGAMMAARVIADELTGVENPFSELFRPSRSMFQKQLWNNVKETGRNFLFRSPRTCPHLGCALKWNEAEHSWDCPCHGSRFSETGEVLDNPANGDMKV